MGGRIAEELNFGSDHMTTGASNDLERASELARKRFENREARLSRLKRERAGKMARRKQMLKDKASQQDRIRASVNRAKSRGDMSRTEMGQAEISQDAVKAEKNAGKADDA